MFKKTLVSLFFPSNKLQILQLNSARKKVIKFASVELPKGLIKNFQVQDKTVLAEILKNIWTRFGLKEKSVGIVVPEFSTFTKLFLIPKLNLDELDEAVRWQAQEFLPKRPEDLVMDWKIVKREDSAYQILAVAIDKEILKGYVDSVVYAGLFPLVVETPSISLARFSDRGPAGNLILYNNFGEGVLIVSQGEKIFGSSVVSIDDPEEIIKTAGQIMSHFRKEVNVEKISIAGAQIPNGLPEKLGRELGKRVGWIKPAVAGLSQDEVQEYLIPISLQLKELAEPSDENTVNLLPSELVKRYENEKLRLQVWGLTLTVSLFIWFTSLATLATYFFMVKGIGALKGDSGAYGTQLQEQEEAITEVKQVNQLADKVLKINSVSELPEKVFNTINKAKQTQIKIIKYEFDLDTGKVKISGRADTRQALIEFKQRLEENSNISTVIIPFPTFEVETNLDFEASFVFLPVTEKSKKAK